MTNKIIQYYDNLSDDFVRQAVAEIQEDEKLGEGTIKLGGKVRECSEEVGKITGGPPSALLFTSQVNLLRQAAFRWIKQ